MAKPNYQYEKRQKDLAKQRKKQEKEQEKALRKATKVAGVADANPLEAGEGEVPATDNASDTRATS
jgi:hypothetical protein